MRRFLSLLITPVSSILIMLAQSESHYRILEVETLKEKTDSIAISCLGSNLNFYGYTAILQTNEEGILSTKTYPLDASFRYALSGPMSLDYSGISISVDSSLTPEINIGSLTQGKLPIVGDYMSLSEAIKLFMENYDDSILDYTPVVFFRNEEIPEPIYIFITEKGQFIIGAISGGVNFIEL